MQSYGYLALCVLVWGTNWPLVKIALTDCPPYTFMALRLLGGAFVLSLAILLSSKESLLPLPNERLGLACVGLLSVFGALTCMTVGLKLTQVGRAMLLMYTMQLWAVPLGIWLVGERATCMTILGSIIGFVGVILFFNPRSINWNDRDALIGSVMLLCSAISWAWGSCLYRKRIWTTGYLQQVLWQLVVSIPLALVFAVRDIAQFHSSTTVWGVLAYSWVAATAIGYWAWSKALTRVSVSIGGQVVLFAPLLGFAWSRYLFGERWTLSAYIAAILIAVGVLITLRDAQGKVRVARE
ncbi:MAG: DMT family transporter [Burkholderiales bacterium]